MIFLAPLIVIGLWQTRRARVMQAALWYALLLFAVMTLVFTFAGDRGGLFHSTGALLPFFYAAAPLGLDAIVDWIAQRRRTWRADRAKRIFSAACVVCAVLLSFFVYRGRVIGPEWSTPIWNQAGEDDEAIGRWLADQGAADPIVLVNNPPSFTYYTGLRSIVIPYGSLKDVMQAARQFDARWLVVDANRPELLAEIDAVSGASLPLVLSETIGDDRIFEIVAAPD
jgi:amino acid transporter